MALLPANQRRVGKENWLSINLYFILFCSIRGVMSNLFTGKPLNLIKSLIFAQNINKLYTARHPVTELKIGPKFGQEGWRRGA